MNVNNSQVQLALQQALANSVLKMEGKKDRTRKFDETVDLILNIRDVDIKNPNNRIDQEVLLPHGIEGNKKKSNVCFIAKDDMEIKLKDLGYAVINPETLEDLQKRSNKEKKQIAKQYEYFVARGDLMRNLAKVLARFLGQQGKMPRPQPKGYGVISPNENIEEFVARLNRIIKVEMKKALIIQLKIGKKSQSPEDLMTNIESVLQFVETKLPNGFNNVKSIFVKTSMGKPVRVSEGKKGKR